MSEIIAVGLGHHCAMRVGGIEVDKTVRVCSIEIVERPCFLNRKGGRLQDVIDEATTNAQLPNSNSS
jgi:hypothetical protein